MLALLRSRLSTKIAPAGGSLQFRSPQVSLALPETFGDVATGPATLGIRPEHLRVQQDGAPADLEMPVRLVEPLGKDTLLYFDIGAERPFIAITEGLAMAELEAGDRIGLTLTRDCLFLFGADGRRISRGGPTAPPLRARLAELRS